jgi:hypothetical protein
MTAHRFSRTCGRLAQDSLEFREELLDRIKVGGRWRRIAPRASIASRTPATLWTPDSRRQLLLGLTVQRTHTHRTSHSPPRMAVLY